MESSIFLICETIKMQLNNEYLTVFLLTLQYFIDEIFQFKYFILHN